MNAELYIRKEKLPRILFQKKKKKNTKWRAQNEVLKFEFILSYFCAEDIYNI